MAWYDLDQAGQPTSQTISIGRLWQFRFRIPPAVRDSLPPARGTDVSALQPFLNVGCVGMTGFGARVKNVTLQVPRSGGDCEMHVEVIEPQGYTADATGPELKGSRKERREAYWMTGEMLFVSTSRTGGGIPVPSVTRFKNLDNQVEGGSTGRVCEYLTQDKDTIPGLIFTQAHFKTAGMSDYREAGVAKVSIKGLTHEEEMMFDSEGKQIVGPCFDEGYAPSKFVITKGEASALKKKAIIVIETAYASLNPANLLYYIDTVNANHMTGLGLPAETLRMLAPDATRWWKQGALWYADYSMLYDPEKGHNNVWSIEQTKIPFKMPVSDEGGIILPGEFKTVYDWWPCYVTDDGLTRTDTMAKQRKPYPLMSWSALDGMIRW